MPELPRTRVYLVRHCDVRNPKGILYGHYPGFGLSDKGVQQAQALGTFFESTPVRAIYTSPLERATESAGIIASHLDGVPVERTDDLIEAKFGHYIQGVRPRDVPWRRPLWFIHMVWPGLLPNDESVGTMARRVGRPIERLIRAYPGEGGICISHGDPIQAFWVHADRRPPYALHRLQCAKGGMLVLDYEGERLAGLTYRSPRSLAVPQAVAAGDASHA